MGARVNFLRRLHRRHFFLSFFVFHVPDYNVYVYLLFSLDCCVGARVACRRRRHSRRFSILFCFVLVLSVCGASSIG